LTAANCSCTAGAGPPGAGAAGKQLEIDTTGAHGSAKVDARGILLTWQRPAAGPGASPEPGDQPETFADYERLVGDRSIGPEPLMRRAPVAHALEPLALVTRELQIDL
jgi:hypothetical protein